MIERWDTGHSDHVDYRDRDGRLIGHTHATPSFHTVTAYDVLGRSREFVFERQARDWIERQYKTLGPSLADEVDDQPRLRGSGRLVATASSPDLVARRDVLEDVVGRMPPDVSDELGRVQEALQAARVRVAATGRPEVRRRLTDGIERLCERESRLVEQVADRAGWLARHAPALREYKAIGQELHRRADRRLSRLQVTDQAHPVLGEAPSPDADRSVRKAWWRAAREYVAVEQRHGGVDPSDREATRRLRELADQLHQARQPARQLGPTIER